MSTSLSIAFIPEDKGAITSIYEKLSNWIDEIANSTNTKEILDLADYTTNKIKEVNSSIILESNRAVVKEFFLTNYKPFELNCDLWLYGLKYNQGYPCKTDGNIRIILDEREIWGLYRREHLKKEDFENAREYEITVLFEFTELFNDLIAQCEPYVKYASFYTESGIVTPLTSSMAYYKDISEFVKDFHRVLIESRLNINILSFYNKEKEFKISFDEKIENDLYYKGFFEQSKGNLYDFISSIREEDLEKLNTIDKAEAMEKLHLALKDNPNVIFNKTRKKEGFVLCTYPLSGLWPVYYNFLNRIKK